MKTAILTAVAATALAANLATPAAAVDAADYTCTVEIPRVGKDGQPTAPSVGHLWLPDGVKTLRGLLLAGKIMLEPRICRDPQVRAACAGKGLGILYFEPHFAGIFNYANTRCAEELEKALADLAVKSGHPEVARVPWLTMGHSTGGIFCRNVAYWRPERVIGVIHIMSGNFQDGIQDKTRTLAGVPLMAINGEFEEYGPAGGDLKAGLRSAYSLNAEDKKKQNQTQWVMVRMQIIERRRKNPDNLMSLVVHRGRSHTQWSDDMSALCAQFIRSAADARIPAEAPEGQVVTCKPLKAADGWLGDADIKDPKFEPAPYADYTGDKTLAFWYLDKAIAEAVTAYHKGPWDVPDPTAGQPPEQRFKPPRELRDSIDGETAD